MLVESLSEAAPAATTSSVPSPSGAETKVAKSDLFKMHPVTAIFPEMSGAAFAELVGDIKENGLREPVLLHPDGSIIDGRNRYRACLEAGVQPTFRTWDGERSLVALVLSLNLHRRHLDESQRAMVGARTKSVFDADAKQRQLAAQNNDRGRAVSANLREQVEAGKSAEKAAALVNVSPRSVEAATKVAKSGVPELINAVDQGKVSVAAAIEITELPAAEQRAVVAAGPKATKVKAAQRRRAKKLARGKAKKSARQGKHTAAAPRWKPPESAEWSRDDYRGQVEALIDATNALAQACAALKEPWQWGDSHDAVSRAMAPVREIWHCIMDHAVPRR